jgi:lipopolysaccharide export system protein LptA
MNQGSVMLFRTHRRIIEFRMLPMIVLCGALAVLWPRVGYALKSDSDAPMEVKGASTTGTLERGGDLVVEGGVSAVQGTRVLKADRAVVRRTEDGIGSIVLTGKEVTFREKRDNNEGWIDARADRVEYDGKTNTLKLIGKARLETDGNTLDGDLVTYNLDTRAYSASGGNSGSQVRAVLLPAKKDGKPSATKQ